MKSNMYEFPKSSFLGMQKDTSLIMEKILSNKTLLKLIYYSDKDCLRDKVRFPDLTSDQIKSLFERHQISNIPKVKIDENALTFIRVAYDAFTPNGTNTYFRDHIVEIKIICHFEDWDLGDFELRPYRIAGEIDAMLNDTRFSGIGLLTFISADQDVYDEEYGGVTLRYLAVRGDDDKLNPLD